MRSEKEKMLAGAAYNAADPELVAERECAQALCREFNALPLSVPEGHRQALLARLFGRETDAYIMPPFYCDYGYNVTLGSRVFFNYNCVILDVAPVSIGSNTLVGPAVQIYTAYHPMNSGERRAGLEYGKPIAIGDDVWIGGGAILCPGITVGAASVIGAGSVVTRDIPERVFAAGNPCRVVRGL